MLQQTDRHFLRIYDLTKAQKHPRQPAAHQEEALKKLSQWFNQAQPQPQHKGGILVLPTGGGKTFTADRFLCTDPLPNGYKVLWLAHTHHLLEQAFYSLESEVKQIHQLNPQKRQLKVRVVSGTKGHFRPCQIEPDDDIVVCTLQTVTRAQTNELKQLKAFLKAAGDKLFVIFDEAHHSPAASYYQFINNLRKNHPKMYLLGLTATPFYTDQKKSGRLKDLFPQDILYQVSPEKLMAVGILAKPVFNSYKTVFTPEFDENKYKQWVRNYQDLPEDIITKLAENHDRNSFIARTYAENKERYGKTIIFADRWFQCEQLREFLEQQKKGIKVGTIYSHIEADSGSADAKNKFNQDGNSKVLEAFRKNELDVLINVRMLTEGTDVPNVDTVFLTRQTTSKILLTQMVGRALRGQKFGGTEQAYIVSFIDDWQQSINWAEYDPLEETLIIDEEVTDIIERKAMQLISVDLVRQLIKQMNSEFNINPGSFLAFIPIGWYRVEFETSIQGNDDIEAVNSLVMVFENERESYQEFIEDLKQENLDDFAEPDIKFESKISVLESWENLYFDAEVHIGGDLLKNIFYIVRHMALNDKQPPDWFDFELRKEHDLDQIAQDYINKKLGPLDTIESLKHEYAKKDRYWQIIYHSFRFFKYQYDACVNWILLGNEEVDPVLDKRQPPVIELSDAVKKEVKERDSYRCLCCGEDSRNVLVIDHIIPRYHGGTHSLDNLQTLCRKCNNLKSINTIDFRKYQPPSKKQISTFPQMEKLIKEAAGNVQEWKQLLRRNINFFYQCNSVKSIIKRKCTSKPTLSICLEDGIDRTWVKPHIQELTQKASSIREWEIFIK
ncbi:hypothetical protein NIES2119_18690 [[Phormidium ambiguum] IAM M-71]|uniref:Helicase n=1 Tax=[Phormidium ambiguum] IAM M-71 TaxID=454136 RepID=A0A1U7IGB0_9CYAN|nr:DEAD/DEAH box helicase family protein [Phormidium ambiguum]OKH36023.1 hypothetical protein NIES2119_18690 [Phormidium ambiguum IAM M-71]